MCKGWIFLTDVVFEPSSLILYGFEDLTLLKQIVSAIPEIDFLILVFKQSISDSVFNLFVRFFDLIEGYCNFSARIKFFLWLKMWSYRR